MATDEEIDRNISGVLRIIRSWISGFDKEMQSYLWDAIYSEAHTMGVKLNEEKKRGE